LGAARHFDWSDKILKERKMLDYLNIRRDLHQIPEIGLEEYKTHAYLMQVIDGLTAGLDFVEIRTWRTGILVFIKGSSPDKTIGWGGGIHSCRFIC